MNATPKLVRPRFASNLDPHAALWIARLAVGLPASSETVNTGLYSEEIRGILGISPVEGKLSKVALRALLKIRAEELALLLPVRQSTVVRNVAMFGELLGLDKLQEEILVFAAMAQQHPLLSEFITNIRNSSIDAIAKVLAIALKVTESAIRKALHSDSQLLTSRIVYLESSYGSDLKLELTPGLLVALFSSADNLKMLMRSFLETAPAANLAESDFAHLAQETALLTAYLSNVGNGVAGVNILIYGPPGTGKTEYVRWLAATQQKQLYQVRAANDQGIPVSGTERLSFFQLSQRFLHKSNALMLFDEIEDVFPEGGNALDALFGKRAPVAGKMYINRILENNFVPTIWVSNEVGHIDKAYLRRFDFSLEMGIPPVAVRRGILEHYLQPYKISAETLHHLSQQEQLSPSQVEKAAKVLKLSSTKATGKTCAKTDAASNEETLLLVIENSMQLLSQDKTDASFNLAGCSYQLDYLNPDCDVKQLVAQLKFKPDAVGSLCFYGAPGTGKTALAHYIAREIELPLMIRRASDIISPYVGETEQKIAAMFKRAQQDGALLLLDEADSFLTDRKSARNSWEITAVNEMLTQMESFKGLFICSTNLMQKLDEASLRRFALKIKFDYLKPEQRWLLFKAHAMSLSPELEPECRTALNQLNNLTPGDFATVRRQSMLLGSPLTALELLKRLKQECSVKTGGNARQIGFIQSK